MKVYVVTSSYKINECGEFDIEKIFQQKKDAENYVDFLKLKDEYAWFGELAKNYYIKEYIAEK